jgi:hypothetical protein
MGFFSISKSRWRPSKGDWGWFGSSSGSKTAKKAHKALGGEIEKVRGRKEDVGKYFQDIGAVKTAGEQVDELSSIEKFMGDSYNIRKASEEKVARTNLANVTDVSAEDKERALQSTAQLAQESRDIKSFRGDIDMGREKQKSIYGIEDLIRQLSQERESYS